MNNLTKIQQDYPEVNIGKTEDIRNQKFYKLLPLYRTTNKGKQPRFVCLCECGNYTVQNAHQIRTGKVKSCGCWRSERLSLPESKVLQSKAGKARSAIHFINYSNQKIGKITFIKIKEQDKNGNYIWEGLCECGNQVYWPTSTITKAIKKNVFASCGCYQYNELNLINQKFGKLTALYNTGKQTNSGNYLWYCKCDCGNKCEVSASNLVSGNTQSYGCLVSKNESTISQMLLEMNLPFLTQYHFFDCFGKFDFFVANQYVIEYDGSQHFNYKITNAHWNTEEQFISTRKSDLLKNQYCFNNNIPIIRIPYDEKYDINDLKLETTRFLLTPENETEYYESRGLDFGKIY